MTRLLPGPALDRLARAHDTDVWPDTLPPLPEELAQRAADVEGLLSVPSDDIDASLIAAAPRLKVISNYAVGYDNIDLAAAAERGIAVGHTPGVLTEATADLTFALLLAAARLLPQAMSAVLRGEWRTWEPTAYLGAELSGATLGIIGLGRIGKAVARRADGFGMRVMHTTSTSTSAELTGLLSTADFVSLHSPLTEATHHLIDATALKTMKPGAILINTARGGLVDHEALADALNDQQIAGAALDVTEPEPLPNDHPLLQAPNLIVTPHIGSATHATRERMADLAVDNLLAGLAGDPMPHAVPLP